METRICKKKLHSYDIKNRQCPECKKQYNKEFRSKNNKYIRDYQSEYKSRDPEKWKNYINQYFRKRIKDDPLFKLKSNLSKLISISLILAGYSKKSRAHLLLGADYETVKRHLEHTFYINYGIKYSGQKVHIDHIIPNSSAKTEELIKLQHYSNLQYLTPEDNLRKSARYEQKL